MPKLLTDAEFPFADWVHLWDWQRGHFLDTYSLRLWYPPRGDAADARTFFDAAWSQHLDVWAWLEAHFEFEDQPDFETDGRSGRLAAYGRFSFSERR